jgi:hypothetical protein
MASQPQAAPSTRGTAARAPPPASVEGPVYRATVQRCVRPYFPSSSPLLPFQVLGFNAFPLLLFFFLRLGGARRLVAGEGRRRQDPCCWVLREVSHFFKRKEKNSSSPLPPFPFSTAPTPVCCRLAFCSWK